MVCLISEEVDATMRHHRKPSKIEYPLILKNQVEPKVENTQIRVNSKLQSHKKL